MKVNKLKLFVFIILAGVLSFNTVRSQENLDKIPMPVDGIKSIMENVKYPEEAKKAGEEGKVLVKAVINTNGDVIKTAILKSATPALDEAALEAIKKTKFTPGIKDEKFVQAEVTIPVLFKLNKEKKQKD